MFSEIFEELGFSPNEAKIYEVLLSTGEASVSRIAVRANIHRRNIYDALNRLVEKGLVFRIFQSGEHLFQPVNPDKLMEILKEKEKKLIRSMPELKTIFEEEYQEEAAYIYRGLEGFKNYMRDMARVAEDTYFLGAKGLWFSPKVEKSFLGDFQDAMRKKKKKYFTIFDPRVLEKIPQVIKEVGGEYRVLPKEYPTPGIVDIFGSYVVTFNSVDVGNFGEDGSIFVMVNKKLAESYRTWFQFIWDHCS